MTIIRPVRTMPLDPNRQLQGLEAAGIREDVKIPHSRMTKTCWETLVTCFVFVKYM